MDSILKLVGLLLELTRTVGIWVDSIIVNNQQRRNTYDIKKVL